MPRIGLEPAFQNETYEPDLAGVESTQAAVLASTGIEVGKDTAAVLSRRQVLEDQATALRTGGADVALCDLLDAIIANIFDA